MYIVYILYSNRFKRKYIGVTSNLNRRLKEHNSGYTKSTKPYIPWAIAYLEEFQTFKEARDREKYLKSAAGRRFIKQNIDLAS